MKKSGIAMAAAAAACGSAMMFSTPGAADPYKWCAQYGRDGGRNCGFVTYQQCLATISGIGGSCQPNRFYTGPERRDRRARSYDGDRRVR